MNLMNLVDVAKAMARLRKKFEFVGWVSEKLCAVKHKGKCCHVYLDETRAYPERYDRIWPFKNGKAKVGIGFEGEARAEVFEINRKGERIEEKVQT